MPGPRARLGGRGEQPVCLGHDRRRAQAAHRALPGFGEQKSSIFVALLGKRFGIRPPGWEKAAGGYGRAGTFVSVADIADPESLKLVREAKRMAKAQAKAAAAAKAGGA